MSNYEVVPAGTGELVSSDLGEDAGMAALAEGLVAAARSTGVQLTGPGGLLTGLTKRVLETALAVEMSEHLGYDRSDPSGYGSGDSRNGVSPRRFGPMLVRCAWTSHGIGPGLPAGGDPQARPPAGRFR